FAEFAIGDISRNWLNDERKALNVGVVFTRPILTSTMSVLISKHLMLELSSQKKAKCVDKLNGNGVDSNAASARGAPRCAEKVTIEDIFELPQLNRLVIQGSAVHEYFSRNEPRRLSDLIMVEKSSLFGYGLEKLKNNTYVL